MVTVTTSNAAAARSTCSCTGARYDVRWDPETGQRRDAAVTLENRAPTSGLPDYVIGNVVGLPTRTNRSYVSVYSTLDLAAGRGSAGEPAPLQSEVGPASNVYSAFVDIPPGGSVQLELELEGLVEGRAYRLNIARAALRHRPTRSR